MTVQECYEQAGLDYNDVMDRIGNEAIIKKFAIKFLSDRSFKDLEDGIDEGDVEKAFRAAHNMKGICLNLGFTPLYEVACEITEKLRGRETEGSAQLFEKIRAEYIKLTDCINKLAAED